MHQIDLSKDGKRLDNIFCSVLNKLPDLRMPSSYTLAGEEDFFGKTSLICLVPLRKQEYFDNASKNMTDSLEYDSRSLPLKPKFTGRCEAIEKVKKVEHRQSFDKVNGHLFESYSTQMEKQKERFEMLKRARTRYSKCKIKKKVMVEESGYNKLVVGPTKKCYPFAEPIPESMTTQQRVDVLRDIVVMQSIDWKMLTPVRPNNEKEENYFDRLVYLHRKRYEKQKKLKHCLPIIEPSFKHIRHNYLMQCSSRNKEVFIPLVYRMSESTPAYRGSQSNILKDVMLDVPMLTVSGESDCVEADPNQPRKHCETLNSVSKIKTKQKRIKYEVVGDSTGLEKSDSEQNESVEDSIDERIEEIVENLMNAHLEIESN